MTGPRSAAAALRKEALDYPGITAPLRADRLRVMTGVTVEERPARSRRGLSRPVLGSGADKVIRGSHGPVLVCRPGV